MHVAFVHDLSPMGGAEVSTLHLFEVAKQQDIEVTPIGPGSKLPEVDAVVFSGVEYFSFSEREKVFKKYKPTKIPFVLWDHHVGTGGMHPTMWRRLFHCARATIFVSPLHAKTRWDQYDVIHDEVVLPVGVGPEDFYPNASVRRADDWAVCMMSRIGKKGRRRLDEYIESHSHLKFHIFSSFQSDHPNVFVHPVVPRELLPDLYSSAMYHIDLPCRIMAAGNATYESVLCGCTPVVNEFVGAASWDWAWYDQEILRQKLIEGNLEFWNVVKGVA